MRLIVSVICLVLAGCGTIERSVLLDTAPDHESQLKHPEWAEPSSVTGVNNFVEDSYNQTKNDDMDSLARFLSQQGIGYEIVSGGHVMVKLNQKVHFSTGSAALTRSATDWINNLGQFLASYHNIDIVIEGHTDSSGDLMNNDRLSHKRASEVKSTLLSSSMHSNNIYTRGYGEYMPACGNDTQAGLACNRRVELTLIVAHK